MNQSNWYKLKGGTQGDAIENCFRILPTPPSKLSPYPWYEYRMHRDVGSQKKQVRCGKSLSGLKGTCWLCDVQIPKLRAKGLEARANLLESKPVFLLQVAAVEEKPDGSYSFSGPYLFTPSKGVATDLLTSIFGGKRDYTDAEKGHNITITRIGTGKNDTKYGSLVVDVDASAVPAGIITKLKPFSELTEIPKYSETVQKAAYQGVPEDEEEEVEEEEEKPKRNAKALVEDEEDEEVESGEEEEEEDEPPIKMSKPGKKSAPVVNDEEDEEGEEEATEEDEEDAPPVKGKKKSAVEEDEEEDEEAEEVADEEDEEEPPVKKGKKKPVSLKKVISKRK